MTPCLFIDQDGNEATATHTDEEVDYIMHVLHGVIVSLPEDEGLDKETCYIIRVQVTG